MKIIDCHCHIYPQAIASKAVASIGSFYTINMYGKGTIDDLLYSDPGGQVCHRLIFSVATTVKQVASINRFIAQNVAENPKTLSGLGTLHPDSPDIAADFAQLRELGLKGVKLHHDFQKIAADSDNCMAIYDLCERADLPVLLHTGDKRYDYSNPERIAHILETFPKLKLIGAHFGGWSIWQKAHLSLARYPNFWVDSSSSLYALTDNEALEIIRAYGCDRILYGSDYPMWQGQDDILRLQSLNLSTNELEKIFYRNAATLFNLN